MRDPDKYRTVEVNRMMWRVFKGDDLVGQVRRGMDGLWYAEVGTGVRTRSAAIHQVQIANDAILDFLERVDGRG